MGDFAAACQLLGVRQVKQLWKDLDVNKNEQISLIELDPEAGQAFGEFERLLIEKHGSTKEGWYKAFDISKSVRVEKPKFVAQCKALGFTGDATRLFELMIPFPG